MTKLFKQTTTEQQTNALAHFIPDGKGWSAKFIEGKTFRQLIKGLSGEYNSIHRSMNDLSEDYDINSTTELLERWESALGIPDGCFNATGSVAERRLHVLIKFAKMNVQTNADFVELASLLGFTDVVITPLRDKAFPPYDVPFIPQSAPESRFRVEVRGTGVAGNVPPYDVPFIPGGGEAVILQCIFEICRPANVEFVYVNTN